MYTKETAHTEQCYHPVLYDDFTFSENLFHTTEKTCDTWINVLQKGLIDDVLTAQHCLSKKQY
jgi:hypothetical protein